MPREAPAANWQTEHMDRLYDAAQLYLDLGWSFFPLGMNRKPLIKWTRFQYTATTAEEVEDWFANGVLLESGDRIMQFNLGIATGALSGVVVVDCDNDTAVTEAKRLGLTSPFSVTTTRGRHFYWAHPRNGETFSNHAGGTPGQALDWPHCPGLDFRGDGGFAVLPPSRAIKEDGHYIYAWDGGLDLDELSADIDGYRWRKRYFPRDVTELTAADVERMLSTQHLPFNLAGVRPQGDGRPSIEEELEGLMLNDGDGRNHALTRFVGEKVSDGVHGDALIQEVDRFMTTYFVELLPEKEVEATIRSVTDKDRRTHPDRYDAAGKPIPKTAPTEQVAEQVENDQDAADHRQDTKPAFNFIRHTDVDDIRSVIGSQVYSLYPCLPHPSIMMLYGFSGHGKSIFLQHMLWAAASGYDLGPYENQRRAKVLYLDFENGLSTIADRLDLLRQTFQPNKHLAADLGYRPEDDFVIWSPAVNETLMDMRTADGMALLMRMIEDVQPSVVVIDTIRTAYSGFQENKAEEWAPVNRLALSIRNAGISVILVHHANKPKEKETSGPGQEAGSTNQLTNLETQMRVTQVLPQDADLDEFAKNAYILQDDKAWGFIQDAMAAKANQVQQPLRCKMGLKVSYGKVRMRTDSHRTAYFALCEDPNGNPYIAGSMSLRRAVLHEVAKRTAAKGAVPTAHEIATSMGISPTDVRRWMERAL